MPSHMVLLSPCLHQLPKLHYGLKDKVQLYSVELVGISIAMNVILNAQGIKLASASVSFVL